MGKLSNDAMVQAQKDIREWLKTQNKRYIYISLVQLHHLKENIQCLREIAGDTEEDE